MKDIYNILIADKCSEIVESICRILDDDDDYGWNISIVNSGKQWLEQINNKSQSDLIILGTQLYDTTGLDLVEQIRDYSDIPVLYLSEEKDIFSLVKAFDRGANDYILVPFNEKIFVARLKSLIRREQWDVQTKENRKSCSEREK